MAGAGKTPQRSHRITERPGKRGSRSCIDKLELGRRRGADVGFRANSGRAADMTGTGKSSQQRKSSVLLCRLDLAPTLTPPSRKCKGSGHRRYFMNRPQYQDLFRTSTGSSTNLLRSSIKYLRFIRALKKLVAPRHSFSRAWAAKND